MIKKKFVSILIVNWNGRKYLKNCLDSLIQLKTKCATEIIIVDNGSSDGSIEYITELNRRKKNITLLKNKKNLGFAHANNQGFNIAKGKYILFLNNDTIVNNDFLDILVKRIESDKLIAGVQPKILMMDSPDRMDSSGSFFTNIGFLYHRGHQQVANKKFFNVEDEIFTMKGACMLFKASVLKKVGVFDEDYFAYFEETDLCHRIWLAGYKILYIPASVIYHKGGGSTDKVGQAFIQYHSFKNRIASYVVNFETSTLLWLLPIHVVLSLGVSFGFLATKRFYHFWAVCKALFWDLVHIKLLLYKRKFIQNNIRKVSDKMYLPRISKTVKPIYYWYLLAGGLEKYEENEK